MAHKLYDRLRIQSLFLIILAVFLINHVHTQYTTTFGCPLMKWHENLLKMINQMDSLTKNEYLLNPQEVCWMQNKIYWRISVITQLMLATAFHSWKQRSQGLRLTVWLSAFIGLYPLWSREERIGLEKWRGSKWWLDSFIWTIPLRTWIVCWWTVYIDEIMSFSVYCGPNKYLYII